MNNINNKSETGFVGKRVYIFLSLIAAIPIWVAIHAYVKTIHVHEDEAVSTAATMSFFAGIFAGRYISHIWIVRLKSISDQFIIVPTILIIACIAWLFFHADFPLQGRAAINLLLFWVPFIVLSIALGILIKMVRTITQKELKDAQASAAQSKTELHLLQSQLSPHFLFNTLNNMYGLSLSQHEKVPALILKLSELLRYSVYDANEVFVPLKNELEYINNYIEFEKIRMGDRLVLTTDLEEIPSEEIKIAPMLLIVFIENAFKHSRNTADQKVYIEISLKTWGNKILFAIKNSFELSNDDINELNKNAGFGHDSVRKRLEILYQKEHELNIQNSNNFYTVLLQLNMK